MPKVGGVPLKINLKVQKRSFQTFPRGFRGRATHLTCEKVTALAALCLKVVDLTDL